MLINFKKRICPLLLSILMIFTMSPISVFAAEEDVVSKEKLTEIITEDVNSLDFGALGVDKFINTVNNTVKDTVTKEVKKILTPDNIKILLKLGIKADIRNNLSKFNIPEYIDIDKLVDDVIDSKLVDRILTDKLTQKVIDRTIDYAINDIMDKIKMPTTEEVIAVSKEKLIEQSANDIYNSDSKDVLYYNYKFKLSGFKLVKTITGWNETTISAKVKLDAASVIAGNCKMPDLKTIDYEGIIRNSLKDAVKDVITEEINNTYSNIKNYIDDKIKEIINVDNK